MSCRVLRIDVQDLTTNSMLGHGAFGYPWLNQTGGKIYFVWTCVTADAGQVQGDFHAKGIYFREFDIETETFGAVQTVAVPATSAHITAEAQVDDVGMIWTESTNEFLVFYGDIRTTCVKYSLDGGVNWSAETYLTGGPLTFQAFCAVGLSPTGDVYCWTYQLVGGAGARDTYLWKRPVGSLPNTTWIAKGLFDNGDPGPVEGIITDTSRSGELLSSFKEDGQTGFAMFQRLNPDGSMSLISYWTTDDWTTIHTTTLKSFPAPGIPQMQPVVVRGKVNTERNWALWCETPGASTTPFIAYTDDWGATWTQLGSPAAMAGFGWDESFDRALFIDWADTLYSSVFQTNGTLNQHTAWKNETPTNNATWTSENCDLDNVSLWVENSGTAGHAWYAVMADGLHTKFFRAFNRDMAPVAPSIYHVTQYALFIKDDFVPPPPIIPETPPETSTTRMFRRGVIQAEKRTIHNARRAPGSLHTWRKLPGGVN